MTTSNSMSVKAPFDRNGIFMAGAKPRLKAVEQQRRKRLNFELSEFGVRASDFQRFSLRSGTVGTTSTTTRA